MTLKSLVHPFALLAVVSLCAVLRLEAGPVAAGVEPSKVTSASPSVEVMRAFERRCASCHGWARDRSGLLRRASLLAARLFSNDPHCNARFDGGELLCVKAWLGPRRLSGAVRRAGGRGAAGAVGAGRGSTEPSAPRQSSLHRHGAPSWMDYRKPVDTVSKGLGPFTPCELGCDDPLPPYESPPCRACESGASYAGERGRALAAIGRHCGRCHQWASRPRLLLREKDRILARLKQGHGRGHLSRERYRFLSRAFERERSCPGRVRTGE